MGIFIDSSTCTAKIALIVRRSYKMRFWIVAAVPAIFLGVSAFIAQPAPAQAVKPPACLTPSVKNVRMFDAFNAVGKPDLTSYGMQRVQVLDRDFWADSKHKTADPARVEKLLATLPNNNDPIVLDIEHFDTSNDPAVTRKEGIALAKIARIFRQKAPGRSIGFYGLLPIAGWGNSIVRGDLRNIAKWKQHNDAIAPLNAAVDVLYPVGYTNDKDRAAWAKQIRATICEARRISKRPVYVFVWPEFHEGSIFKNTPIPADQWREQLDVLAPIADGIVLWGGYDLVKNRLKTWDEDEQWWTVTKERMARWKRNGRPAYRGPAAKPI
jgi:hypothetical protein